MVPTSIIIIIIVAVIVVSGVFKEEAINLQYQLWYYYVLFPILHSSLAQA